MRLKETGDFAFNIELFRKGLLVISITDLRKSILESGYTSLANNFYDLLSLKGQIDHLFSLPLNQRSIDPHLLEKKCQ
jgi:hypothetical protein